jgi:hypothetical protein
MGMAPGVSAAMTTPRTAQGLAVPMPPGGFPPAPAPGMWGAPGQAMGVPATTPVAVQSGPVAMPPAVAPYGAPSRTALVPPPQAQRKKGKGGLIAVIIILVVVLGGGGAAAAIFWDDITGTQPPVKGPVVGPVKGPVKGVPPIKVVAPPVKAPAPQWTAVQVTSTPMGASILHEGKEIAKTPAKVRVPPDRLITYVLRHDGHKEQPLVLNPGETANKHLMLVKAGADAPKAKPAPPKPKPKPATPPKPKDPYERLQ